jgi:hypothetical protein
MPRYSRTARRSNERQETIRSATIALALGLRFSYVTWDDVTRLANDNNLVGYLNRVRDKANDIYDAVLERRDLSTREPIASKREQAKACTPARATRSPMRPRD